MKTSTIILILLISFQFQSFGQRGKEKPTTELGFSISYNPHPETYFDVNSWNSIFRDLDLEFITPDSGTFIINIEDTVTINNTNFWNLSINQMNIGFDIRINHSDFFHEVSLNRLNMNKTNTYTEYVIVSSSGMMSEPQISKGLEQSMFGFGLRYELGKVFGDKGKTNFAISFAHSFDFDWINRQPLTSDSFGTKGFFFKYQTTIISQLICPVTKKLKINFKFIPNILLISTNKVYVNDLNLIPSQRNKSLDRSPEFDNPEIRLSGSIGILYDLSESKRRRRRR